LPEAVKQNLQKRKRQTNQRKERKHHE